MLQPSKNTKKAAGTVNKIVKSSAISKILSNIPFADEVYDVANTLQGFKEGDYKKIGSNFIGALLPGISGKSFEAVAEDWLPATPEIEKKKMQFNLKSSPAERKKLFKKYGPGYLSNPQFIKDYKLAFGTGEEGIEFPDMFNEMIQTDFQELPTEELFDQETPAQKAAREAREARIAERAKLVAIQKAKNAVRLAPIEAAQQKRYENWKNSSEDNLTKTYDDWQEELKEAQKGPDVPLEGLEIGKAKKGYSTKGSCTIDSKIEKVKLALGTDINGIMKTKMNPIKKYANGSDAKGMNPNHYIISPDEALNDYNIMLAKAENAAVNNPWAPYVAAIGGAATNFLSGSAGMLTADGAGSAMKGNSGKILKKSIATGGNINATAGVGTTAANGMNNVQADVEVEGGERYETPQGQTGEFQGPSHAEGGIPLEVVDTPVANPNQGEVQKETIVYSKDLMLQGKSLADRQATREKQTANLEKIASQPLVDQAVKNASKRKMMAIQKEKIADLDFQDKVNNIQQMADTMVAAFGTGMAGLQDNPIGDSMRYGYGSGANGIMKYAGGGTIDPTTQKAYDKWLFASADELYKKYPKLKQGDIANDVNLKKDFQTFLFGDKAGTKDADNNYSIDGDFGKTTNAAAKTYADIYSNYRENELPSYNMYPGYKGLDLPALRDGTYKAPAVKGAGGTEMDFAPTTDNPTFDWKTMPEIPELVMSGKQGVENGGVSVAKTSGTEDADKPGLGSKLLGLLPSAGDATKLFGNYLGMTSGIKTATEQRASDVTKTNVYRNAGEESQRLLDNAKQGIETSKAQAIVKANSNTRTGRKGARNSARGVNQMRGMDWLYDTALNQQVADITAGAAQQMSAIDIQKSGVAMNADQLKGQGDWQARMANDADKDAYYTALALGRKDYATGMQQMGKDVNDMKENKIIENLMKQYGTYVTADKSGKISGKNKSANKTSSKVSVTSEGGKTTTSGKTYNIGGKQITQEELIEYFKKNNK